MDNNRDERSSSLPIRVFYAARDGMTITLYALLVDKSKAVIQRALSQCTDDAGQSCPPLVVAALNGYHKTVQMLLEKFQPDLEQEGSVRFDDHLIDGASALWCAAAAGHPDVVRVLVSMGADVDHATTTRSTPLRAACFEGRADIVQYLIDHGADVNRANTFNNTCLMIASFKGFEETVSVLLRSGAAVDRAANCGGTALHFAAECGHVPVLQLLLTAGARLLSNDQGLTPLLLAADHLQPAALELLLERARPLALQQQLDALELLGASYANDKEGYSLAECRTYLRRAARLRAEHGCVKRPDPPVPAYLNHRETCSPAELEEITDSVERLHMESLAVRQRVLGAGSAEVPRAVIFRGAVYADHAQFDRCLQLWLHALALKLAATESCSKDLLRFAQVFSQMLRIGVPFAFGSLLAVLSACVDEVCRVQRQLIPSKPPRSSPASVAAVTISPGLRPPVTPICCDLEELQDELEADMVTALYLLVISNRVTDTASGSEEHQLSLQGYRLCRLDPRTRNGRGLLHSVVTADTPVDGFHTSDICKFPCATTTRMLIRCGADVNLRDADGNTPLHLIVAYQKPISDFLTLHSIIVSLVEADAHLDTCNKRGSTPFESATTGVAEIVLRTQWRLSLQCLAARVVARHWHSSQYRQLVPPDLQSFIERHGAATPVPAPAHRHADKVRRGGSIPPLLT